MPETTRESFTAQEELVLSLVLCFDDVGVCPSFKAAGHRHLKAVANGLVWRGLLYRCYDCYERQWPRVKDMDYGLTPTGREVAQAIFEARGKTHWQVLAAALQFSAP